METKSPVGGEASPCNVILEHEVQKVRPILPRGPFNPCFYKERMPKGMSVSMYEFEIFRYFRKG